MVRTYFDPRTGQLRLSLDSGSGPSVTVSDDKRNLFTPRTDTSTLFEKGKAESSSVAPSVNVTGEGLKPFYRKGENKPSGVRYRYEKRDVGNGVTELVAVPRETPLDESKRDEIRDALEESPNKLGFVFDPESGSTYTGMFPKEAPEYTPDPRKDNLVRRFESGIFQKKRADLGHAYSEAERKGDVKEQYRLRKELDKVNQTLGEINKDQPDYMARLGDNLARLAKSYVWPDQGGLQAVNDLAKDTAYLTAGVTMEYIPQIWGALTDDPLAAVVTGAGAIPGIITRNPSLTLEGAKATGALAAGLGLTDLYGGYAKADQIDRETRRGVLSPGGENTLPKIDNQRAMISGGAQAVADIIMGKVGERVIGKLVASDLDNKFLTRLSDRVLGVGTAIAVGGPTEALQEVAGQWGGDPGSSILDSFTDPAKRARVFENFVVGSLVPLPFGAVGVAGGTALDAVRGRRKGENIKEDATVKEVLQPEDGTSPYFDTEAPDYTETLGIKPVEQTQPAKPETVKAKPEPETYSKEEIEAIDSEEKAKVEETVAAYNKALDDFVESNDAFTRSRPQTSEEFYQRASDVSMPVDNIVTTEDLKKADPILRAMETTKGYTELARNPELINLKEEAVRSSVADPRRATLVNTVADETGTPKEFLHTLPTEDLNKIASKKNDNVRFYHGTTYPDTSGFTGPVFVSPQEEYARNYRGNDNNVFAVDIPKKKAEELGLWDTENNVPINGAIPEDIWAKSNPELINKPPLLDPILREAEAKAPSSDVPVIDPDFKKRDVQSNLKSVYDENNPDYEPDLYTVDNAFDEDSLSPFEKSVVDNYRNEVQKVLNEFNLPVTADVVDSIETARKKKGTGDFERTGEAYGSYGDRVITLALASADRANTFTNKTLKGIFDQAYHNSIMSTLVHEMSHALDYLGSLGEKQRETFDKAIPTLKKRLLAAGINDATVTSLNTKELFAFGSQVFVESSNDSDAKAIRDRLNMTRDPAAKDVFARDFDNPYVGTLRRGFRKVANTILKLLGIPRQDELVRLYKDLWKGKYNPTITTIHEQGSRMADETRAYSVVHAAAVLNNPKPSFDDYYKEALDRIDIVAGNRPLRLEDRNDLDIDKGVPLGFGSKWSAFITGLVNSIDNLAKRDASAALAKQLIESMGDDTAKYRASWQPAVNWIKSNVVNLPAKFALALDLRQAGVSLKKDRTEDGGLIYKNRKGELVKVPASVASDIEAMTKTFSLPLAAMAKNARARLKLFTKRSGFADIPVDGTFVALERWFDTFNRNKAEAQKRTETVIRKFKDQYEKDNPSKKRLTTEQAIKLIGPENLPNKINDNLRLNALDNAIYQRLGDLINHVVEYEGLLARGDVYVPEMHLGNWAISVRGPDNEQIGMFPFDRRGTKDPSREETAKMKADIKRQLEAKYGKEAVAKMRITDPFEMTRNNLGNEIGNASRSSVDLMASLMTQVLSGHIKVDGEKTFDEVAGMSPEKLASDTAAYLRMNGLGKHLLRSKHLEGASPDVDRVIPAFFNSLAHVASNSKWHDAWSMTRAAFKEQSLKGPARYKFKHLVDYLDYAMDFRTSAAERFFRGFSYRMGLAYSPMTAAIQLSAIANAVPANYVSIGIPFYQAGVAFKDAFKGVADIITEQARLKREQMKTGVPPADWWFTKEMLSKIGDGLFLKDKSVRDAFVKDAMANSEHLVATLADEGKMFTDIGPKRQRLLRGYRKARQTFDDYGGYMMSLTERAARLATFAGVYKHLFNNPEGIQNALNVLDKEPAFKALRRFHPGMSDIQAISVYTVADSFANPHRGLKMKFTRGTIGGLVAPFLNMVTKMFEQQMYLFAGGRGVKGVAGAVGTIALMGLLTGLTGATFGLESLVRAALEVTDGDEPGEIQERRFLVDLFGKEGADFVGEGLLGSLGLGSLSRRMGLGAPFVSQLSDFMTNGDIDPKISSLTGIVGSTVTGGTNALSQWWQGRGDFAQVVSPVLPNAVRGIVRGFDILADPEGTKMTSRGKSIGLKSEYTTSDIIKTFLGITPDVARMQNLRNNLMRTSRTTNEGTRKYYLNTLSRLKVMELNGDPDARRSYNEMLEAFKQDMEDRGEILSAKDLVRFEKSVLDKANRDRDPYTEKGMTRGQKRYIPEFERLYGR